MGPLIAPTLDTYFNFLLDPCHFVGPLTAPTLDSSLVLHLPFPLVQFIE